MVISRTMESEAPKAPQRQLVLRFISGKYQGGEFPLAGCSEVIVGRTSDLDLVLIEDMVSRRHARLDCSSSPIVIEDLGSTNGTFVNGERITRTTLKEGDRILIGTSILKLIATDASASVMRRREEAMSGPRSVQTRSMTGSIEEIPLPDLLQLFGSSKKTGVLAVHAGDDVGKIFLKKGVIVFASINDDGEVSPLKSAYRILSWIEGNFELLPQEIADLDDALNLTVQEFLMEGLRQIDELNAIRDKLPALTARLVIPRPLRPALRALGPVELDMLQLAYNHQFFSTILNKSTETDLDIANAVLKLLDGGYLQIDYNRSIIPAALG